MPLRVRSCNNVMTVVPACCRKTPNGYAYPVDIAWGNMGGSMQVLAQNCKLMNATMGCAFALRLHLLSH